MTTAPHSQMTCSCGLAQTFLASSAVTHAGNRAMRRSLNVKVLNLSDQFSLDETDKDQYS